MSDIITMVFNLSYRLLEILTKELSKDGYSQLQAFLSKSLILFHLLSKIGVFIGQQLGLHKKCYNCLSARVRYFLLYTLSESTEKENKWLKDKVDLVKEKKNKEIVILDSNIGDARKVFPHWSQETITHHCLSVSDCFTVRVSILKTSRR